MKSMLSKFQIVALAAFVGLGASTLISEAPAANVSNADKQIKRTYTLSRYFPDRHENGRGQVTPLPYWPEIRQSQQPQNNATGVSLPANTQTSENWAGYVVTPAAGTGSYTSVSGSWTVPKITAAKPNALAAQWIGLGGVSTKALLQMGTIEEIENGQTVAEVFWEKLPAVAQNVLTVPVGSTISASIAQDANSSLTWNLTFTVNTPDGNKQTKTIPVTLDSAYAQQIGTSAEWISEDPSNQNNQLYPLANMGTVNYSSALANGQPLASAGNVQPVAMVSRNGNLLVAPSALGTDGESFSTSVISTDNPRPIPAYWRNGGLPIQIRWTSSGEDGFSWVWTISWSW